MKLQETSKGLESHLSQPNLNTDILYNILPKTMKFV